MLIVTRRPKESVVMTLEDGRRIVVRLLGVKGLQLRIGVECDRSITVHRDEIQERVDQGVPMKEKAVQ